MRTNINELLHIIFLGIASILLVILMISISSILLPFVTALILSYLLSPLVSKIEGVTKSRTISTIVVMTIFFGLIIVLVMYAIPILIIQLKYLYQNLPQYVEYINNKISYWMQIFVDNQHSNMLEMQGLVKDSIPKIMDVILASASSIIKSAFGIFNVLSLILITPIISFYLLRDWNKVNSNISFLVPEKYKGFLCERKKVISLVFTKYLRGQMTICLILGLIYGISLMLVGLNSGFLIGIATGLISFIPYIGMITGVTISLIVALVQYSGISYEIAIIIAIFIFGQLLETSTLSPKLLGEAIGLHPVIIILGIMSGGVLFGFWGMLLAIPIISIIESELSTLINYWKKTNQLE